MTIYQMLAVLSPKTFEIRYKSFFLILICHIITSRFCITLIYIHAFFTLSKFFLFLTLSYLKVQSHGFLNVFNVRKDISEGWKFSTKWKFLVLRVVQTLFYLLTQGLLWVFRLTGSDIFFDVCKCKNAARFSS